MEGRAAVNLLYDDSEQALAESLTALLGLWPYPE